MPLVTFYFQLHQPLRLNPEGTEFLWEQANREVFVKVAQRSYLPALRMFVHLIRNVPAFKICLSLSGTFMDQARRFRPEVLDLLRELYQTGMAHRQVEFLEETYYHSLAALFFDPAKAEFKEQVSLHRQKMAEVFGVQPVTFRNTELIYNNEVASLVSEMGYPVMLCEQRADMFAAREGQPVSPHVVYRAKGIDRPGGLTVLARNRELSDDVAFRFGQTPLMAEQYARFIAQVDGEMVLLGYDFEHIGEHLGAETGIFEFWRDLPKALEAHSNVVVVTPSEVAERFKGVQCPGVDIPAQASSSWADAPRDTRGWLGSSTQHALFRSLESLETEARKAGGQMLRRFRMLTCADHLYYLHEGQGPDQAVHASFNPYGSVAAATYVLTRAVEQLRQSVRSFNVLKRPEKTPVLLITPETARLPHEGMGQFAQYVSGKSGGMGEVISALCKGLAERKIPVHLITLNLARRFREEAGLSEAEWVQKRHQISPQNVHLVTSSLFENFRSAYDGNPLVNAAEFQRQVVNVYIKSIRSYYQGRAILHTNDWMAGGVVAAYASLRGIPVLHTVHNTHTGMIPTDMFFGVNLFKLWDRLYTQWYSGKTCIDAQATAIKNATRISYVGHRFLAEVVEDCFLDRPIIPGSVRQETKIKSASDLALVIPNGISPDLFPERQTADGDPDKPGLARCFGPYEQDLVSAKKANLVKFQRKIGLAQDPEAILLYWPSRLDPVQKGVELLEQIAQGFIEVHPGVQIAVVGDPVNSDGLHVEILGRIACASCGRIAFHRFDEDLCILGYAAATDVFGASLYEPFGQIDVVGNLYGATATNRDTGGYHDKIMPLGLKAWGAPIDRGNGVLFRDYDPNGLWWGLHKTVENHQYLHANPQEWDRQIRRIMLHARQTWSLENMVAGYITTYEQLNGGQPLA